MLNLDMFEGEVSPELQETKVVLSREEIEARMTHVQESMGLVDKKTAENWKNIPGAQREKLDEVFNDVYAGKVGLTEARSQFPQDGNIDLIFESVKRSRALDFEQQKLQKEYRECIVEDVTRCAKNLSSRVNFEAFIEEFDDSRYFFHTLGELFELRRIELSIVTGAISGDSIQHLDYLKQSLVAYESNWSQDNFLRKEASPDFEFSKEYGRNVTARRQELATVVDVTLFNFDTFVKWDRFYRGDTAKSLGVERLLEGLGHIFNWGELHGDPEGFETIDFDPRLLDAAEKSVSSKIQYYALQGVLPQTPEQQAAFVANVLDFNPLDIWSGIHTVGFDEKEDQELLITEEEVLAELRNSFPAYFLKRVESIVKKENTEGFKVFSKEGKRLEAAGCFRDITREGQLVSARIEWYSSVWAEVKTAQTEEEKKAREVRLDSTVEGINHEVGHAIHFVLTYDDLKTWHVASAKDREAVSWYAKYAKGQDHGMGAREGFAETVELFTHYPMVLAAISPNRFEYMRSLFEKYSQPAERARMHRRLARQMRQTARYWRSKGWTEDDAIRVHTKYERRGKNEQRN